MYRVILVRDTDELQQRLVSNVVEVGRKSVPGGWDTVGETSFSKSSSRSVVLGRT